MSYHTPEGRERIRQARLGSKQPEETKKKISESLKKRQGPSPMLGRTYSEDHRKALSEAQKTRRQRERKELVGEGNKRCPRCETVKPLAEFPNSVLRGTGGSYCSACYREYAREWRNQREDAPVAEGRVCSRCKEWKTAEEFSRARYTKSGLFSTCKDCTSVAHIERKYGLGRGGHKRLLELQDGHCAACPATDDLHVDHCHDTMNVRGILCGRCNVAAGQCGDDPDRLESLARYLRERKDVDMRQRL